MFQSVGVNIKQARKSRGLTQKQLAEKAGIAEISLRQYENNKRKIRLDTLISIANALNIVLSEMVDLEELGFREPDASTLNQINSDVLFHAGFYEGDLVNDFRKLNVDGQNKALELVKILTEIPRFRIVDGENNGSTEK